MLRKWDGELRYLPNFKFRRFGIKDLTGTMSKDQHQTKIKKKNKPILEENKIEKKSTKNAEDSKEDTIPKESVTSEGNSLENDFSMIID